MIKRLCQLRWWFGAATLIASIGAMTQALAVYEKPGNVYCYQPDLFKKEVKRKLRPDLANFYKQMFFNSPPEHTFSDSCQIFTRKRDRDSHYYSEHRESCMNTLSIVLFALPNVGKESIYKYPNKLAHIIKIINRIHTQDTNTTELSYIPFLALMSGALTGNLKSRTEPIHHEIQFNNDRALAWELHEAAVLLKNKANLEITLENGTPLHSMSLDNFYEKGRVRLRVPALYNPTNFFSEQFELMNRWLNSEKSVMRRAVEYEAFRLAKLIALLNPFDNYNYHERLARVFLNTVRTIMSLESIKMKRLGFLLARSTPVLITAYEQVKDQDLDKAVPDWTSFLPAFLSTDDETWVLYLEKNLKVVSEEMSQTINQCLDH